MTPAHRVAAEYLALTTLGRAAALGTHVPSDRLMSMTGLGYADVSRLRALPDKRAELARRRAACNRYTLGGAG